MKLSRMFLTLALLSSSFSMFAAKVVAGSDEDYCITQKGTKFGTQEYEDCVKRRRLMREAMEKRRSQNTFFPSSGTQTQQ